MKHDIANVTVKGGFPVMVTYQVCPAEPDVGIDRSYLTIYDVMTSKGKPAPWLKLTMKDFDDIEQQLWDQLGRQ